MRALRRLSALRARVAAALLGVAADDAVVAGAPPVAVREIFRRFWPWARPYRRWLWLTLVFVVLGPLVDTAVIWLFKEVVDRVLVPHDFGPFGWIALAYLGLTLLSGLVGVADRILSTWVGERFLADLRVALFEHLQRLSLEFFERRPLGDVLARLGGDVGAIEDFVLSGVADALSYTLNLAFFAGALFYLRWELALVSLAVAPLFFVAARTFSERIKHAARERRRRSGSINAVAEEALANAALVQAYNRQATETERFREQALGSFRAQLASARIRALFTPVVDVIELVGAMLVIALGTWELTQGRISLGGLLAFLAYLTRMYGPIRGLSRLSNQIFAASASAERVIELLDERPRILDRPGARPAGRARELVFEEVGFRYPGAGADALSGLSFRVGPGETLALVGASGAGKSTVAKLALRFYEPDRGRILLDGADVAGLTVASVRENLAVVLQETLVFDATVAENIAYGRPGASEQEIREAARAADAEEFVLALPDGYQTRVGQRGRRLSGGQRQRLAIARAMLRDAPVLVLDEPTTGLDRASAERILEPLRRLREGRAAIVISHDLLTVREATEIVVLAAGVVVERGTHDELVRAGGTYAQLHRLAHPPAPAGAAP